MISRETWEIFHTRALSTSPRVLCLKIETVVIIKIHYDFYEYIPFNKIIYFYEIKRPIIVHSLIAIIIKETLLTTP
jgi:hypothetical protein